MDRIKCIFIKEYNWQVEYCDKHRKNWQIEYISWAELTLLKSYCMKFETFKNAEKRYYKAGLNIYWACGITRYSDLITNY